MIAEAEQTAREAATGVGLILETTGPYSWSVLDVDGSEMLSYGPEDGAIAFLEELTLKLNAPAQH